MNWKRALLSAAAVFLAATSFAEIQPLMMNFQGKLINPTTNNPQSGVALLTFQIFNAPTGGSALWTETSDGVSLTNGVFNVTIGSNTALSRDLFLGASAYLQVTVVSVNGVADGTAMTPRTPLVMSPYAFTANQLSDNTEVRLIAGITYSTFTSGGILTVPFGVSAPTATFTSLSTFTVISSSGMQIINGMLDVSQSDGINANNTGISAASGTFTGPLNGTVSSTITWNGNASFGSSTTFHGNESHASTATYVSGSSVTFAAGSAVTFEGTVVGVPALGHRQYLTASGTYTPTTGTTRALVRIWGGGGSGGGCTNVAGCASGGGGSGGYAETFITGITSTMTFAFTISTGAPGVASLAGVGAANTTFVVDTGLTITVFGGGGGGFLAGTAVIKFAAGGKGAAVSTGGQLNAAGVAGRYGSTSTVTTTGHSGGGGPTSLGGDGIGISNNISATSTAGTSAVANTGSGGAGAIAGTTTAVAGGAGASGLIIIDEYQ